MYKFSTFHKELVNQGKAYLFTCVYIIDKHSCSCTGEDDASAAVPCLATDGPTSWRDVGIKDATCSVLVCVK